MDAFKLFIMLAMSVLFVMSVSALDPVTENLLTGLENSKVSRFANTSHYVYHLEIDKSKPGYVMYTDKYALKTSNGNITETIAGELYGYKEGVGEDARFDYILGFTQISPTRVIVLDYYNECLRQVDRVTRVTSVSAGQCQSRGYQDGVSAKFYYPIAVIVDMKNSKQLLVADRGNRAVRTVEIESKNVGTLIKSYQLNDMEDLVQDKITGDVYITGYKSLSKLSYNTKSLILMRIGSTGQINEQQLDYLRGLSMIETVIVVTERDNDRILKYDTVHDTWSPLNVCDVTKTHKDTDKCGTESPTSILLTSNRLLIGGYKNITSYKPVCNSQNKTVYTDPQTGSAQVELAKGYSIDLSEGTFTYETPGPCSTTFNVINNLTDVPPQTLTCPKKQVALTSPENGLATFRLKFGDQNHILMLPLGPHSYIIKSSDRICNVTLDAEDHRVSRTLELVADYSVDCSVVNSTVTWSLLKDVAQQKYTVIEALCGSACKTPGGNARPVISCDGVDELKIRWPTDLAFTAGVVSVPANIRQTLEKRIRASGPTLDVVLFGATPPIVYPRKAANGGYVSISLSTTCINGLGYSEIEKKCV